MNQRGTARLLRFAACVPAFLLLFASAKAKAQTDFPDELLLRLRHGASIDRICRDYGLTILDRVNSHDLYEVSVVNQDAAYATEYSLNSDSRVRYCEPEPGIGTPEVQATPFHIAFGISKDPSEFNHQKAYDLIDLVLPGSKATGNGRGSWNSIIPAIVAVLDTGVDFSNANLAGRLLYGFNALDKRQLPLDLPDGVNNNAAGHGTMITGIITRVSPDSVIMPIRVMNGDGVGSIFKVIKGIHYAERNGASVINMSFETDRRSVALEDALNEAYNAGIVLIASVGNDSTSDPRYPAAYPTVIGVASVEDDNTLSPFSNYGPSVSLVAPGDSIRSTYLDGSFANWSGTSFASPFVTAEAAELIAMNPTWSAVAVTLQMLQTANNVDYLNPQYATMLGAGIIDFQAAITVSSQ